MGLCSVLELLAALSVFVVGRMWDVRFVRFQLCLGNPLV